MKPRVLLVEDEAAISEPLAEHLAREGFDAGGGRHDRRRERSRCATGQPDIVLLDVMLPDGDGRDLCREIRKGSDLPIIMLTARGEETDRIVGLELGADDYVVKPFSAGELVARMRAILRRGRATARRGPIEVGDDRAGSRLRAPSRRQGHPSSSPRRNSTSCTHSWRTLGTS